MPGQIPMTRPPGYGAQLGQTLMAGSSARGEAVAADLDARSSALRSILGNIKGIAEVGGGAIAPDMLISQFAGGDVPVFNNDYAGMADRLRLAQMQADVNATNRRGMGGGSGGGDDGALKPGQMLVRDPNGNTVVMKTADLDETFRAQVLNGQNGYEVIQMGPIYGGTVAGGNVVGGGGGGGTEVVTSEGDTPASVAQRLQAAGVNARAEGSRVIVTNEDGSVEEYDLGGQ